MVLIEVPLTEFSLIERYFARQQAVNTSTVLGIGDDCGLLSVPPGYQLAVTTDTMVEKVHFFADVDPWSLGYKLLAVNLSDLASMGAKPIAITLAMTLPEVNEPWLKSFTDGLFALAGQFSVDLIGGDTTSGALTLTLQAMGLVAKGKALKRSTANPGDLIFLTGSLGDAGLGLKIKQGYHCTSPESALERFDKPLPRVSEGLKICDYATACIDLSDGLLADLGHILDQSNVGAIINFSDVPLSTEVKKYIAASGDWQMPLIAGDDYELCFTVHPQQARQLNIACCQIGVIQQEPGLRLFKSGVQQQISVKGFEHFS